MISIVIPTFNSEKNIRKLYLDIKSNLELKKIKFECIFVDDASKDNTWLEIKSISNEFQNISAYRLSKNFGQQNATLLGVRKAKENLIITMDDDFQHPPREIIKLLDALDENTDIVYGVPLDEKRNLFRNVSSIFTKIFFKNLLRLEYARKINSFRLFRKQIIENLNEFNSPVVDIDAILSWTTDKVRSVEIENNRRIQGKTGYNIFNLINYFFNMLVGISVAPLRLALFLSLLFLLFGIILFIYVIITFITTENIVPGFTFLASLILIFSAVQVFLIGILGEYISKIFSKSISKPQYMIKDKISNDQK